MESTLLGSGPSWAVAAWLLAMAATSPAAHAQETFHQSLQTAVNLYKDLEYEQALEQIQKARRLSRGTEEEVSVYLHEGIILGDMGQQDQSRAAFKKGLLLNPHAKLPFKVAPKLELDFERQRVEAHKELGIAPPPPTPPVIVKEDRPTAPVLDAPSEPTPPYEPGLERKAGPRVPVIPVALSAAGVVAAGAGTWLGLQSRSRVNDARSALLQDEARAHLDDARSNARMANILFGTAGVAVTGALVTWLVSSNDSEPSPVKETH